MFEFVKQKLSDLYEEYSMVISLSLLTSQGLRGPKVGGANNERCVAPILRISNILI